VRSTAGCSGGHEQADGGDNAAAQHGILDHGA
jgi:hypothetical protein